MRVSDLSAAISSILDQFQIYPHDRQFPPGIVQLIVEASLDRYDRFTVYAQEINPRFIAHSSRIVSSTRPGAASVSRSWSNQSNVIRMDRRRQFWSGLSGERWDGGRSARFLHPGESPQVVDPKLFESTPHFLNLYHYGGTMNANDLPQLERLRRLKLRCVRVAGSPSSSLLCLPDLRRLSMTDLTLEASAFHFLAPASFPQLRRIDTDDLGRIARLIQQLEIVTSEHGYEDYTLLSRATSLLLLPLSEISDDRLAMFSNLPSLPLFLHIDFTSVRDIDVAQEVALALDELLEAKNPDLRIILLNIRGIDDSIRSLIQRFQERGIRVQMVGKGLDFDGAIVKMDRIRAMEERAAEDGEGRVG